MANENKDAIRIEAMKTKTGIELISEERRKQIEEHGYSSKDDASLRTGQLWQAAVAYAETCDASYSFELVCNLHWPFDKKFWKPSNDRRRNLIKAGALIAAEIDRLNDMGNPISTRNNPNSRPKRRTKVKYEHGQAVSPRDG